MKKSHFTSNLEHRASHLQPQTILVTGGAGFIGSHLVDVLIERGYKVVVIDNLSNGKKEHINKKAKFYKIDICSPRIVEIFKKEKPGIVFHFAAQINVRKSVEDPLFDAKVNILGSLNVIQNFVQLRTSYFKPRTSNVQHPTFIFASTGGAIYGEAKKIPTPENYPANPISPYGIAKLTVENYLRFYKENFGLKFISLRFSNVYGPRQDPKGEAGVVAIFIDKLLKGERPTIFGNGNQTRDFIFVEDVAFACLKAMEYKGEKEIFNIGTGIETSINELYKIISKLLRTKIKPKYAPEKPGDLKRSCLDISLAKRELKWKPKYNLEEGVKKTIEWTLDT
jgi:UDP-glucose 4-epimerase